MTKADHKEHDDQASPKIAPFKSKSLYVLHGTIQTPPMSSRARLEVGYHLRRVQDGESLVMPLSRPMPTIGDNCHELRIGDMEGDVEWRIIYHIDDEVILVLDVFKKKTRQTPENIKEVCRTRLKQYKQAKEGK